MTEGSQNQRFVWGNSLLSASGDDDFYYLQDHLDSPIRLLGEDQNDTTLAYDEFGVPLVESGQNPNNPFGFTGYQADEVSGLYYAQARYYEPQLGRFGAEDTHWNPRNMIFGNEAIQTPNAGTLPYLLGMEQSANLYLYVINSPINYIDPLAEALRWPGEVHSWVAQDIVKNNNGRLTRERWMTIPYDDGIDHGSAFGRVDLVDRTTGAIWEIRNFGQKIGLSIS